MNQSQYYFLMGYLQKDAETASPSGKTMYSPWKFPTMYSAPSGNTTALGRGVDSVKKTFAEVRDMFHGDLKQDPSIEEGTAKYRQARKDAEQKAKDAEIVRAAKRRKEDETSEAREQYKKDVAAENTRKYITQMDEKYKKTMPVAMKTNPLGDER